MGIEPLVTEHHDLDLSWIQMMARSNGVSFAVQLLWFCQNALKEKSIGVVVSGRDDSAFASSAHSIVGMLIAYNRLPAAGQVLLSANACLISVCNAP